MSDTERPAAPALRDFQRDGAARNPFANDVPVTRPVGALANAEQQRAIAEVQARMLIARANPRDAVRCMDAILVDCTRPSLAKGALYQYARGGSSISGPSIRLAEAIAQKWGNIASGIKEISRAGGYSECVAYAWDLETGYYDERQFQVRHWRDTKGGGYALTDERDIYELIANMGQRRKRAVLLTVIPGDVVEAAVDQCESTLSTSADTSPEALKRMVAAFMQFNVTQAQIEKRCQCRVEAIRPAQIVQLSKIFASLNDGMSAPGDWFEQTAWTTMEEAQRAEAAARKPTVTPPKAAPAEKPQQAPAETQQTRPAAQRKAPAKRAAAQDQAQDGGPPDDRWPPETEAWTPPGTTQAAPAATQAPVADPPSATVEPAPEGAALPTSSGGQAFEAWLLDENGDPALDEPFSDPVLYAEELHRLWRMSAAPENIVHQNADGIEDAQKASDEAAQIIATMDTANIVIEPAPITVVPLTMDRGKPAVGPYLKDLKEAVAALNDANYLDFIAANIETLRVIPLSTRSLCLKALVERARAIGVQVPPTLAESLNPAPAPAQNDAEAQDAAYARDAQQAENQILIIDACATWHELDQWSNGAIAKALGGRFQREGKDDLYIRMKEAFDAKKASFQRAAT